MPNSNTDAERASGSRQTPGEQSSNTTNIDTDREVITDRDGRELSLYRVADAVRLPVLGYTESAIAWGSSPTRTATHAGHISIDVSSGIPAARYYPRTACAAEGAPFSVSLSARILDPEAAGYEGAPFAVRLLADEFVTAKHGSSLPPAFDLVYWSLADNLSADTAADELATDGGYHGATDEEVREAVEATEEEAAWKPEPVSLRDGETPDVSGHAARNLALIEQALEDGIVDTDELSADQREQLDDRTDEEAVEDDAGPELLADGGEHVCETCGKTFEREETLDAHQYYQQHDAEIVTDGGREQCIECGSFLVDEIEDGTGVYCPQCGTGQHVTDGGLVEEVVPVCALEDPDTDDSQVVAHGMDLETVRVWDLEAFVIEPDSPHWTDELAEIDPGESVTLQAGSYDEAVADGGYDEDSEVVTDGGQTPDLCQALLDDLRDAGAAYRERLEAGLLGDRAPEAGIYVPERPTQVTDGGLAVDDSTSEFVDADVDTGAGAETQPPALTTYDEVYDHDHEQFGEIREVVEGAYVGGGRTVDRLRIRWDSGEDEWFHRSWIRSDAGRQIERVERDDEGDETGVY